MAFGQKASTLQKKISFNARNLTAAEALKAVEMASGYTLAYPAELLTDVEEPISLIVKEETLESVLRHIFKGQQIRFELIGRSHLC